MKIRTFSILNTLLLASFILVAFVFLKYKTVSWPGGRESVGCIVSAVLLILTLWGLHKITRKENDAWQTIQIRWGLIIGLLWTVEICINNFLQPPLPYRDFIDNSFWVTIAFFILFMAIRESILTGKLLDGLKSGCWTGFASGAVACFTALMIILLGMQLLLSDPLNLKEWSGVKSTAPTTDMAVYFAYETLAGAVIHLYILGLVMGLILGMIGGLIGSAIKMFLK